MANVKAHFALQFYAVLPDDDGKADEAFDRMGEEITTQLNRLHWEESIVAESFTIEDGDTELDE